MSWKYQGEKTEIAIQGEDNHHKIAIGKLVGLMEELGFTADIVAIGHRIVHGGEKFTQTVRITEEVTNEIESLSDLAPLHNPAGAVGIRAAIEAFPSLPQFAVFDTAFHQTMPQRAFTGAIAKSYTQTSAYVVTASTVRATTSLAVKLRRWLTSLSKNLASFLFT